MGKKWKQWQILFSWFPKSLWMVTAATKLKKHLLLRRKAVTNLDSILKSRDVTLLTKEHTVKAMVFPVVLYGCESWTIKKAESQRIDAFELCWRRLSRVPWTARRSNESTLKEINPEQSLEGLMLKLKLQYFGHLMQRANSLEKTLMLELWGQEQKGVTGWDGWTSSPWRHLHESMDMSLSKLWEMVKEREVWQAAAHGVIKSQTWLSNWTTTLSYTRAVKCVLSMNSNVRSLPNSMISIYIISLQNTYIYL